MRRTSEILKEFRKTRGMTAAMMAEKLGISTVTMSAIDVGRKKLSEQMLEKLETMLPKDDFIDLLKIIIFFLALFLIVQYILLLFLYFQ